MAYHNEATNAIYTTVKAVMYHVWKPCKTRHMNIITSVVIKQYNWELAERKHRHLAFKLNLYHSKIVYLPYKLFLHYTMSQ